MSTVGASSALILFPLAGWLLWASLAFSYLSAAASDACESEAFWTSGWFFAPPLLAIPGLLARRPLAAGSIFASVTLIGVWAITLLLWLITAIGCGAG